METGWKPVLQRVADDVTNHAQHLFLVDWLLEERDRAGREGFFPELRGLAAGDEDDGRVTDFVDAAQPVENQESIPRNAAAVGHIGRREIDVENDEVRTVATNATDRRGTIHRGAYFVTCRFELDRKRFKNDDVVVGNEDFWDVRPLWLGRGFWR